MGDLYLPPRALQQTKQNRSARNFDPSTYSGIELIDDSFKFDVNESWACGAFCRFENIAGDQRSVITKFGYVGGAGGTDEYQFQLTADPAGRMEVRFHNLDEILGSTIVINRWYFVAVVNRGTAAAGGLSLWTLDIESGIFIDLDTRNAGAYVNEASNTADIWIGGRDDPDGGDNMDGDIAHAFCIRGEQYSTNDVIAFSRNPEATFAKWVAQGNEPIFYLPLGDDGDDGDVLLDHSGKNNHGVIQGNSGDTALSHDVVPIAYNYFPDGF